MKERIEYMDSLRGLAMLIVVVGHVLSYCIFGSYLRSQDNVYFRILNTGYQNALFFAISGFFMSSRIFTAGFKETLRFLYNKFVLLVVPAFVFLLAYDYLYSINPVSSLYSAYKDGYWFTITLFVFMVFLIGLVRISAWLRLNYWLKAVLLLLVAYVLMYVAVWSASGDNPSRYPISQLLSLNTLQCFVYYVAGYLLKERFDCIKSVITNKYASAAIVSLTLVAMAVTYHSGTFYIGSLFVYLSVITMLMLATSLVWFSNTPATYSSHSIIGRYLKMVGNNTLGIYFIHFFIIRAINLRHLDPLLADYGQLLTYVVALAFAIVVIAITMMIVSLIKTSPWLARHLLAK